MQSTVILNAGAMQRALTRMAHEIVEANESGSDVVLIGMHRDDLAAHAAPPMHPTVIPFDVADKTVILVDDVLFSGRTTRAALDALNDFGRPKKIQLAVLVDRGHRELPIKADFVGKNAPTSLTEKVIVRFKEADQTDEVVIDKP